MKRFFIDSLIFLLVVFILMGITNTSSTLQNNDNLSSFDQNFTNDNEVNDGYVNGEIVEEQKENTISKITYYISDGLLNLINGGTNMFKKVVKSMLD